MGNMKALMPSLRIVTIPKSTFPLLGIPIEGERPFVVLKERFKQATRGINITDWAVLPGNGDGRRHLTITHSTGRVHGRMTFYELKDNIKWQVVCWTKVERERLERLDAKPKPEGKYAQAIAKLERQRKKLRPLWEHHCLLTPKSDTTRDWYRERELHWHETKPQRKRLARIAGLVLRHKITPKRGYKLLRETGFTVLTKSQVREPLKSRLHLDDSDGERNYWRALPQIILKLEIIGGMFSHRTVEAFDVEKARAKRYEWLSHRNAMRELEAQIAGIREMEAASAPAPAPAPTNA
jgi:hypothetical protein